MKLLPADVHVRASGRLHVAVTRVLPSFQPELISQFDSKARGSAQFEPVFDSRLLRASPPAPRGLARPSRAPPARYQRCPTPCTWKRE